VEKLSSLRRSLFLVSLPLGILLFALPIYGKRIGADAVQICLFFSVFSLMTVLIRPIVGTALDRFGRRPFLILGLSGYAGTMFIIAFSDQVWHITLARACEGTAYALLWLSVQAITADAAETNDRGRSFGSMPQASYRGAIIGTFIGFGVLTAVGINNGWRPLFLGYAITCLIAALLALLHIPETNPAFSTHHERRPLPRSRPWVLLLLVTAVTGASWAMITPILMIFLQEKLTADVASLGAAYLPAALIWAVLPSRLGALADRFGRKPLMVLGLVAAASSSFYIPHIGSLLGLAAIWAFQALCYAAGDPAEEALVADLTGGDQRGRAYGMYTMAAGLGATLGPLVGGWLYEAIGSKAPFYANGIVLAICAIILAGLLKIPGQQRQPL